MDIIGRIKHRFGGIVSVIIGAPVFVLMVFIYGIMSLTIPYTIFSILYSTHNRYIDITDQGIYCQGSNPDDSNLILWSDIHQICQFSNHKAPVHPSDYYILIQTKDWISSVILTPSGIRVNGIDKTASYKAANVFVADTLCARARSILQTEGEKGVKESMDYGEYIYDIGNYTGCHEDKDSTCDWYIIYIIRTIEQFSFITFVFLFFYIVFGGISFIQNIKDKHRKNKILNVIKENEPISLSDICKKTGYKKEKVSSLLQEYKKEKLVRHEKSKEQKGWFIQRNHEKPSHI